MNNVQMQSGKNNIHEPLTVDHDNPIGIFDRDILKRRFLAERILSRLREDDCPRALGIYGGWGTGKTSLINLLTQLNENLPERGHRKLFFLSVDAWEYEVGEGLLIPVVVELKKMMGADVPSKELFMVVKRVLLASTMVVADVLLKKYANLDVEKFDLSVQQIQNKVDDVTSHDTSINYASILRKWEQQSIEVESTKKAFENLIEHACQRKDCTNIAICIDNLDRCSPDNVVRLLESVKVFFNVPHCTWVFAVDSEVIASYINHKYEGTRMDGNSYLDKIIPEQYHLSLSPGIDRQKIVNLLRFAAGTDRLELDERNIPQLPRVLVPRRLIKSAAKLSEFYRLPNRDMTKISKPLVFNLALLYHAWPGFYQRFSSDSEMHIRGILDNFFPPEKVAQVNEKPARAATAVNLLPLLKDYVEDQDLAYFIKTAFSEYEYPNHRNSFVLQIIDGIRGLRETGLP